jgi:protein-L-isoaspartate(D-aspartate) O-methyltransferase
MLTLTPTFDGKRTIPSAEVTRLMVEMLNLGPQDKVLEVGTGSGSQTQAFAQTGAEVHSIELEPYIDSTKVTGTYIFLHAGDGRIGLPQEAPFSVIVATCGIAEIPKPWQEQLADGGRLLAPVGDVLCQKLTLFRKQGSELIPERIGAYVKFQMLRRE